VNQLVERCQLVLRAGEGREEERDKWGKTRSGRAMVVRSLDTKGQRSGPEVRAQWDECGVAIKEPHFSSAFRGAGRFDSGGQGCRPIAKS
jgi:hypothetical protein